MTIDQSLLKTFNEEDVRKASYVLEQIFIKQEQQLQLDSEQDIQLLKALIKATDSLDTRYRIFDGFERTVQMKLFLLLPYDIQLQLLSEAKDGSLLSALYQSLEPSLQKQCLSDLFKANNTQYDRLKKTLLPSLKVEGGLVIGKAHLNTEHCFMYAKSLFDKCINLSFNKEKLAAYTQQLIDAMPQANLLKTSELFFRQFFEKNIPLSKKEDFAIYMRFFETALTLVVIHPNLMPLIDQTIDAFLLKLKQLPSDEWIAKILNQLPLFMLKKVCMRLKDYERIPNGAQRSLFCKYYKGILAYQNQFKNIKIALDQL